MLYHAAAKVGEAGMAHPLAAFGDAVRGVVDAVAAEAAGGGRCVATFDADCTLWDADMGEAYARWLLAGGLLPKVEPARDVYGEYEERLKTKGRVDAYSFIVEVMEGLPESDVVLWARQLAAAWPNYRPLMRELVRFLSGAGVEVWIVSASNRWAVQAAAEHMDVLPERVLAVESEVEAGVLTSRMILPVTCEGGKVEAIRQRMGVVPVLACGDSFGDREMLEHAKRAIAVGLMSSPDTEFLRYARTRGWPVQLF
jgi:phosphoserine phosphatase